MTEDVRTTAPCASTSAPILIRYTRTLKETGKRKEREPDPGRRSTELLYAHHVEAYREKKAGRERQSDRETDTHQLLTVSADAPKLNANCAM